MEKLEWKTEKRKVSDLKTWDKNPRKITKEAFEKLKQRIIDRGFHDVLKVDIDNTVLSGNQRKQALVDLGVKEVNVIYPSRALTDDEKAKIVLESNRSDGEWDYDMLANFDSELLGEIGFTDDELVVGFGLNKAETSELDLERLSVLQVDPPEAPDLKERVVIKFDNFVDFTDVKEAIQAGKIDANALKSLL